MVMKNSNNANAFSRPHALAGISVPSRHTRSPPIVSMCRPMEAGGLVADIPGDILSSFIQTHIPAHKIQQLIQPGKVAFGVGLHMADETPPRRVFGIRAKPQHKRIHPRGITMINRRVCIHHAQNSR